MSATIFEAQPHTVVMAKASRPCAHCTAQATRQLELTVRLLVQEYSLSEVGGSDGSSQASSYDLHLLLVHVGNLHRIEHYQYRFLTDSVLFAPASRLLARHRLLN